MSFSYKNFRRTLKKNRLILSAKIRGNTFFCNALSGDSNYNIVINSDMSISCNCNDFKGKGQIGNLNNQSIEEIFASQKATFLRKKLAEGKFPIFSCIDCFELRLVDKKKAEYYIENYRIPKAIMIENTSLCNLNCLGCRRKEINNIRKKSSLTLNDIENISLNVIKKFSMDRIAFFNLGEPFIHKDIKKQLDIIKKYNPKTKIFTSTNGVLLEGKEKINAAMMLEHIFFSIDGSNNDELNKYQRNGNFEKVISNMKTLIEYRNSKNKKTPVIEWKYVLFRWNDSKRSIDKAIQLAGDIGVDIISFWPGGVDNIFNTSLNYFLYKKYKIGFFNKIGRKCWKGREVDFRSAKDQKMYGV